MKGLYLLVNLFTIAIPFVFSFHPKLEFYKKWKTFFVSNGLAAFVFISWDIAFTRRGVWWFNPDYVLGIYFFNLPLEEILFFICIPFACVFSYHCLNLFFRIEWKSFTENVLVLVVVSPLLMTGIYFHEKLYTTSTFISLALLLLILKYIVKINWLPKLLAIYPLLLIPFFIVNGILTGSGLPKPVVLYDDLENLGIRLFTIPVEDIFYGFELILLNLFIYEGLQKKFKWQ